jgi:hypothetical protein
MRGFFIEREVGWDWGGMVEEGLCGSISISIVALGLRWIVVFEILITGSSPYPTRSSRIAILRT